jgi:hypothetical protein
VHFDEGCPRFDEQDLDEVLALADAMLRKVPDHGRMLNDLVAAMLEVDSSVAWQSSAATRPPHLCGCCS